MIEKLNVNMIKSHIDTTKITTAVNFREKKLPQIRTKITRLRAVARPEGENYSKHGVIIPPHDTTRG